MTGVGQVPQWTLIGTKNNLTPAQMENIKKVGGDYRTNADGTISVYMPTADNTSVKGVVVEKGNSQSVSQDSTKPTVTNNLQEFITNDTKLKGILYSAGLIDENNNFKKPVADIANAITEYYQKPENMTHIQIEPDKQESTLAFFGEDIIAKTPEDGNTFKILDGQKFATKLAEFLKGENCTATSAKGNLAGNLEQKTTTPNPDSIAESKYGKVDPKYIDTVKNNLLNKYGLQKGEEMFKQWVENNTHNGMIMQVGKNYYTSNPSLPTVEADDETSKKQLSFLDRYDANTPSAREALNKTKYYELTQGAKKSLEQMHANDKLNLTDSLGGRPVHALDVEYYSMTLREDDKGNVALVPKYFETEDPQWQAFCKEQTHWENQFNMIAKKPGIQLNDQEVDLKKEMLLLYANTHLSNDKSKRTTIDIEAVRNNNTEYIKRFDMTKFSDKDITDLSNVYSAYQMKQDKSTDSRNPHVKYENIDYERMANVLVHDRYNNMKSTVYTEYASKIASAPKNQQQKLIAERNAKLAEIRKEESDVKMEDRADYATLMTEGKSGRDEAKTAFDNTIPHWDKGDKKTGKKQNDGKNHTEIGKKGRAYVERKGITFAKKSEGNERDYDYKEYDPYTGETKYYKLQGNATKADYDFIAKDKDGKVIKDKNGQPIYCKFDGNEWQQFWLKQSNLLQGKEGAEDYFFDLDEARGKAGLGEVDYVRTMFPNETKYDKQKYINTMRDFAESAGIKVEANNTVGLRAVHLLKMMGEDGAKGVGGVIFGNLANQFSGIKYSGTTLGVCDEVIPVSGKTPFKKDYTYSQKVTIPESTTVIFEDGTTFTETKNLSKTVTGGGTVEGMADYKDTIKHHSEQDVPYGGKVRPGLLDGALVGLLGGVIESGIRGGLTARYVRDKVDGKSDLYQVAQQQYLDNKPPVNPNDPKVETDKAKVYKGTLTLAGEYKEPDTVIKGEPYTLEYKGKKGNKYEGELPFDAISTIYDTTDSTLIRKIQRELWKLNGLKPDEAPKNDTFYVRDIVIDGKKYPANTKAQRRYSEYTLGVVNYKEAVNREITEPGKKRQVKGNAYN